LETPFGAPGWFVGAGLTSLLTAGRCWQKRRRRCLKARRVAARNVVTAKEGQMHEAPKPLLKQHRPWWSALTFDWLGPLLRRGHAPEKLQAAELAPPPRYLAASGLASELSIALEAAVRIHATSSSHSGKLEPLLGMLARLHRRRLLLTGCLRFANTAVQFLPVLCLGSLLSAIQRGCLEAGFRAAVLLFATLCAKAFVENQYFYHVNNMAIRVRAMLQATIYSKSLRLPEAAAAVPPVTLMQVDAAKVETLAYSVHNLWNGVVQVVGYSLLLVRYLGVSALAGLVLMCALLPINHRLNQKLSELNREFLRRSETRVTKTNEILEGIRAIRQMGWEEVFERTVSSLRDEELSALRCRSNALALLISTFSALPPFMTAVVLFAYAMCQGASWAAAFQPSIIFSALALLDQMRFPLLFYPFALDALAEGKAAARRIFSFLGLEEARATAYDSAATATAWAQGSLPATSPSSPSPVPKPVLVVPPGRYALGGDERSPTLIVPDGIAVQAGELVAIIGAVGSGKSTLVRALLGELPIGGLEVPSSKVAYCSQQPWVQNGTLREVITAGMNFDKDVFADACVAAALDFASISDEISSGTLSGGQQARVALARAVYHASLAEKGGVCVFDDVTAALDPQVAAYVVDRCLFGALRDCTRVIVTSDTGPLLRRCDVVVVMEADGDELRVRAVGNYAELARQGISGAAAPTTPPPRTGNDTDDVSNDAAELPLSGGEGPLQLSKAPPVKLTVEEERAKGAVPWSMYKRYLACADSPGILAAAVAAVICTDWVTVSQQWFIGLWTADATMRRGLGFYLAGVSFLGTLAAALAFGRSLLVAAFGRRASRSIHRAMCESVLARATVAYFDANPLGRILQRFAKDLEQVDVALPNSLRNVTSCFCTLLGAMTTVVVASPRFLLALPLLVWTYVKALQLYLPVARELKRLEALARSPVYSEQAAAAEGVATIRQLRLGAAAAARGFGAIDGLSSVSYTMKALDRWFSLRMELLGNFIVFAAAAFGLIAAHGMASSPWASARAAVAVTQTLGVVGLLNWTVRTMADTETSFSSFQRVAFTIDATEAEAPRQRSGDRTLAADGWPTSGRISLRDVSLRYRDDLPLILKDVDLEITPGQRVGIVGRTGSGKSTVLRVLLRTVELQEGEGTIRVDGVDIRDVGLKCLRSAVTVIPQDNFITSGSVRENVDPEGVYSDDDVREALQEASLSHWPLERHISAGRGGISPGERQLLGVARAVLRNTRVMALDEVTSRVDEATDQKVQAALKRLPASTTVLVVSHRIQTLLDYDVVVVMEAGRLVEHGPPRELCEKPSSHFARLLAAEASEGVGPALAQAPTPTHEPAWAVNAA